MVVHAGPLAALPHSQGPAFPQGKNLFDNIQHIVHGLYIGKGPVIGGSVFYDMPGAEHPGKGPRGKPYYRVGFAVLKVDIVFGAVLLDQGVFQEQRFVFIGNDDGFDGSGPAEEDLGFDVLFTGKIGGKTVPQYPGFAHIDDAVFPVPHDIYPRFLGSFSGNLFKVHKIKYRY
jgi:hypothetical protein